MRGLSKNKLAQYIPAPSDLHCLGNIVRATYTNSCFQTKINFDK